MNAFNFREPVSAWTHFVGLMLALPGTLILLRRVTGEAGKRLSLLVYGLSLIFCYAASALYHGVRLPADRLALFVRLDSIGIFALIAGSYTPLAWNLMRGRWRTWTLLAVWGTAVVAITLIASGRRFSPAMGTRVYLGMGWGVVVCYARIARVVPHRALLLVILGGLFYSVGAVLNLLRWPALWPGVFGVHDLFHLFVMAGSLAHYGFILKVVVPFGRGRCEICRAPGTATDEAASTTSSAPCSRDA
ncbi:MAG: hemolysin III family protein [Isosphaeraceae bacterium]|nr:hemolysin III family protein [Isosphaeraceae bacterium]